MLFDTGAEAQGSWMDGWRAGDIQSVEILDEVAVFTLADG